MLEEKERSRKVAIVGLDQITATNIYSLLVGGRIHEVILVGGRARQLISDLKELRSIVPLSTPSKVVKGTFSDCSDASVAVITSGSDSRGGAYDLEHLRQDAASIRDAISGLKNSGFAGILLVTRQPVEILTQIAIAESKFLPFRVFGLGGHEDLAGFLPGKAGTATAAEAVPDDRPSATWCTALDMEVSHLDSCTPDCPYFETMLANPGLGKGDSCKSISRSPERLAACVTQICEAVIDDLHTVIPVFVMDDGFVRMAPCVIGNRGIEKVLDLPVRAINTGHADPDAKLILDLLDRENSSVLNKGV